MLRPLLASLLLALPLAAAPVPKAVKKPAVPSLAGTRWEGVDDDGRPGVSSKREYTFQDDGRFSTTKAGVPQSSGTWAWDGNTLTWEFGDGYSVYTLTPADGGFAGTGANRGGLTWTVKLTPAEKK